MFKQLNPILPVKEILKEINGLADEMAGLSNLELKNKTQEFKERLAQGESLDDLLPEAFAVVREADKRVLGMFPYDVQVKLKSFSYKIEFTTVTLENADYI